MNFTKLLEFVCTMFHLILLTRKFHSSVQIEDIYLKFTQKCIHRRGREQSCLQSIIVLDHTKQNGGFERHIEGDGVTVRVKCLGDCKPAQQFQPQSQKSLAVITNSCVQLELSQILKIHPCRLFSRDFKFSDSSSIIISSTYTQFHTKEK